MAFKLIISGVRSVCAGEAAFYCHYCLVVVVVSLLSYFDRLFYSMCAFYVSFYLPAVMADKQRSLFL